MQFDGAVIREQGVTFAVVAVREHVLRAPQEAAESVNVFGRAFGGIPVILMAQDSRGIPSYFGRRDIVDFLSRVPMSAIPWKQYSLA